MSEPLDDYKISVIEHDALVIFKNLRQFGSEVIVRTLESDYYFSFAVLRRVVIHAHDITLILKNAIE